jgi:hypothetical protein
VTQGKIVCGERKPLGGEPALELTCQWGMKEKTWSRMTLRTLSGLVEFRIVPISEPQSAEERRI